MSAYGTKQTCQSCRSMSAFGGKADNQRLKRDQRPVVIFPSHLRKWLSRTWAETNSRIVARPKFEVLNLWEGFSPPHGETPLNGSTSDSCPALPRHALESDAHNGFDPRTLPQARFPTATGLSW